MHLRNWFLTLSSVLLLGRVVHEAGGLAKCRKSHVHTLMTGAGVAVPPPWLLHLCGRSPASTASTSSPLLCLVYTYRLLSSFLLLWFSPTLS